jgi:hypothetical protein
MKKILVFFVSLTIFPLYAADEPIYEQENVPTTAKVASALWTIGGGLTTTAVTLWKVAPIHDNMTLPEYGITVGLTGAALFVGALGGAYIGKKIGEWSDPTIQYFRQRSFIVHKVTSAIDYGWRVSSYYCARGYYKWNDIRRTHLQGTLFEDKYLFKDN